MKASLFEKLTIVIPTNNRNYTFKRLVEYLNRIEYKMKVIIIDSSKKKKNTKNLPYLYFYLPGKNANIKISKILNQINTKYVVTIADDDFFLVNGLIKSIKFLEKNQDYIGVHGDYYIHSKILDFKYLNFYKFMPIKYTNINYQPTKGKSFDRALKYLDGKLAPLNYAMFRTDIYKKVWKISTKLKREDVIFLELIPCFLFYYHGNIKKINEPYISRERSFRVKPQVEFTDTNIYKIALKFLSREIFGNKYKKKKNYKKLEKMFMSKRLIETNKINSNNKRSFISRILNLFQIFKYLLSDRTNIKKGLILKTIKKYPEVYEEVKQTQMR